MKRFFLCVLALLLVAEVTTAQTGQKKNTFKKQSAVVKKAAIKQGDKQNQKKTDRADTVFSLSSTGAYQALAEQQPVGRFYIADPILRALNAKASGTDIKISGSGIVGVPKGTYGFAHGRIILYPSGATSTGTSTGSGSVGTGSGPGNIGMYGPAIGVNGKSPFTGAGAYGVRIPLVVEKSSMILPDTATKRNK